MILHGSGATGPEADGGGGEACGASLCEPSPAPRRASAAERLAALRARVRQREADGRGGGNVGRRFLCHGAIADECHELPSSPSGSSRVFAVPPGAMAAEGDDARSIFALSMDDGAEVTDAVARHRDKGDDGDTGGLQPQSKRRRHHEHEEMASSSCYAMPDGLSQSFVREEANRRSHHLVSPACGEERTREETISCETGNVMFSGNASGQPFERHAKRRRLRCKQHPL